MMTFEGEGNSAVRRDWVAVSDTTIKASAALSGTLLEHEKMAVARGTRVIGILTAEDQGHWVIEGGMLDDRPLPEGLCFLYLGHWELQPEAAVETAGIEEADPIPEAMVRNEPTLAPIPKVAASMAMPPANPVMRSGNEPKAAPVLSKPRNHRRLFALFKRGVQKAR